ncbi:MAG TPA: hypothetical protein VM344_00425 [Vitreimonas sp.]|nr:hypothetical protein [Vitreimonas sp.]
MPTAGDPEAYAHTAAVLCLGAQVVGEGARHGWPVAERQADWQKANSAYKEWLALSPPTGIDEAVLSAIADFEASWPALGEDPFEVAFRCRGMVSRVRSLFEVTTIPSMPIDNICLVPAR